MALRVSAVIGAKDYATTLRARDHTVLSDEPSASGGQDEGPAPSELVLMGLGSCTSITLRMYAKRKGYKPYCDGSHGRIGFEG
jgi:putative redox protein